MPKAREQRTVLVVQSEEDNWQEAKELSVRAVVEPKSFWPSAAYSGVYEPVPLFSPYMHRHRPTHTHTHLDVTVSHVCLYIQYSKLL